MGTTIEDFYDDDIDGDGFNKTELVEENRSGIHTPYQCPSSKTISGYLDKNGSIILRGEVLADGDGQIVDFGFVLSSSIVSRRNNDDDIWIRGRQRHQVLVEN